MPKEKNSKDCCNPILLRINIFGEKWTSGPSLGLIVSNMIETNLG